MSQDTRGIIWLKSKFPSIANDCDPTNGVIFGSTENTFDLCRCLWAWGLWKKTTEQLKGFLVVICQSIHVHEHLHPLWPARTSKISLILSSLTTCQVKWSVTWVSKGILRRMAWKHSNERCHLPAGDGQVLSHRSGTHHLIVTWIYSIHKTQLMDNSDENPCGTW